MAKASWELFILYYPFVIICRAKPRAEAVFLLRKSRAKAVFTRLRLPGVSVCRLYRSLCSECLIKCVNKSLSVKSVNSRSLLD